LRGSSGNVASWSAFLYDMRTGTVTTLPGLGGTFRIEADAVNDAGVVAGYAETTAGNIFHAVRWTGLVPTDLGTLGGLHSFGLGINAAGDVVGISWMPGNATEHAFLYAGGVMRDLGTLGGTSSYASGINAWGLVVGSATTPSAGYHAFVYSKVSVSCAISTT
jgi:probable HAF family extracellular repeat protein